MSYKINHENYSKNLKIDSLDDNIDDIKLIKSNKINTPDSYDNIFETNPEILNENNDHVEGLDFIANENKRNDDRNIIQDNNDNDNDENNENISYSDDNYSNKNNNYSFNDFNYNNQDDYVSYEEIQKEKSDYLSRLYRLEKQGHVIHRKLGMEHDLQDIKNEYFKIKRDIEIDNGVDMCKSGLMFCLKGIEMLNQKFDPIGVDLDGWSGSVAKKHNDYNDVLEELYIKYSNTISAGPEMKLIFMLAGSGFQFAMEKRLTNQQHFEKYGYSSNSKMKGPSINTDDLLNKLDNDDFSDILSVTTQNSDENNSIKNEIKNKNITIQPKKKRGRKPKKTE